MDKLVWRPRAKIVAYVEAVRAAAGLFVVAALLIGIIVWGTSGMALLFAMQHNDSDSSGESYITPEMSEDDLDYFAFGIWALVIIGAIGFCIEAVAIWKLLGACKLTCEVNEAIKKARVWRNVNVALVILSIKGIIQLLKSGITGSVHLAVSIVIWDFLAIYSVQNFIMELEVIASSQAGGNSDTNLLVVDVTN